LALRDLATSMDVVVVLIPADVMRSTNDPAYLPAAPVQNYLVTHKGVSIDMAYGMTKALWTGLDQLVAAHSAAKAIDLEAALEGMPVPLHPGAEKYCKEVGLIRRRAGAADQKSRIAFHTRSGTPIQCTAAFTGSRSRAP
jgi:hypothetical protein